MKRVNNGEVEEHRNIIYFEQLENSSEIVVVVAVHVHVQRILDHPPNSCEGSRVFQDSTGRERDLSKTVTMISLQFRIIHGDDWGNVSPR